jgi:DNA polymerase-3 subunit beta
MNALSVAAHALSSRSTMPALEGVLMETSDDGLKLTCSDGTMTILTNVPAEIEEEGRIVLPGRLFCDVVKKLPPAEVTAALNERDIMTLRCTGSRTTITGMSADLFPERPKMETTHFAELPQPLIKDMIAGTSFAISSDDTRKILTGGLIEIAGGEARIVTLDGFRLAIRFARVSENTPDLTAVIPGKMLQELSKILSDDEEEMAVMMFGKSQLMLNLNGTQIYTSLLEGEFINYRRTLPASWKAKTTVNREQFSVCVDRAALMARENKSNLIKLHISGETMVITSNSEVGEAYEELAVIHEGEEVNIAFNVRYISDVLRAVPDENLTMRFTSNISPCVIEPLEGDEYLYMVLPVRVNA